MGCGASMEDMQKQAMGGGGGGGGNDADATKALTPITFNKMGLATFDGVFDQAKGCFDTLLSCNGKVVGLVQGLMTSLGGANLGDAIKKAVMQGRGAIEHYMPSNINEIRQAIKDKPAEGAQMAAEALTGMKDALPDIDTSGMSTGDLKLGLPKLAMDKLPEVAKKAMQMVLDLCSSMVETSTDGIKAMKPRIEQVMGDVSGLSVAKLQEDMKKSGLGMSEMMKKPGEFQCNAMMAGKLQEYAQVILKQVAAVVAALSAGYKDGVEFIIANAPVASMQGGTAQASIKQGVKLS